jgi:hypothetical protein
MVQIFLLRGKYSTLILDAPQRVRSQKRVSSIESQPFVRPPGFGSCIATEGVD